MYLALGDLSRHFFIHYSAFCLPPAVAFGGFGPAFIFHPSAFIIHFGVALGSHWGSLGVALRWL